MSQRLAALKALYDHGASPGIDASLDQSVTTFPQIDRSLGLDASSSLDVSLPGPPELTSSMEAGESSGVHAPATKATADASFLRESVRSEAARTPSLPTTTTSSSLDRDTSLRASQLAASEADDSSRNTPRDRGATPRAQGSAAPSSYATPGRPASTSWTYDESSLSQSLRASQLAGHDHALELLDDEEDAGAQTPSSSVSGHWGVQEIQRRTAAGLSMKTTLKKIEQLTAERDDLKIEVDFHRRNMSPDDVGAEVISLRQEKLGYVRRLQRLNELVKSQDQALKDVNRQVKSWEAKWAEFEALQARLSAAEARADQPDHTECEQALRASREAQHALERDLAVLQERRAFEREQSQRERDAMVDSVRAELAEAEEALETARAELAETQEALEDARASSSPSPGMADSALQAQLEEQHETLCSLQDALAAERLLLAEKDGELDRLEAGLEEAEAATQEAQQELEAAHAAEAAATARARRSEAAQEAQHVELRDTRQYYDDMVAALQSKLDAAQSQVHELKGAAERHATQRAEVERLNERLNAKLLELVDDLKAEENARAQAEGHLSQRFDASDVHSRRALEAKDALIESLEQRIAQLQDDKRGHADALARLEDQVHALESAAQRQQEEWHGRLKRETARLQSELQSKSDAWQDAQDDVARLRAETAQLGEALQAETRTRMSAQDRLDAAQRALDDARTEAASSRSSRAPESRGESKALQELRSQLSDRNALLSHAYDAAQRALMEDATPGEAHLVHTDYVTFHDRLLQRLRRIAAVQHRFAERADALDKAQSTKLAYVSLLTPVT